MPNPSKTPKGEQPTVMAAGPIPYLWLLWAFILVLALDQVGRDATVPAHQHFPLLNLGLAAALAVIWQQGWKALPAIFAAALASAALNHFGWIGIPLYALGLTGGAAAGRILLELTGFDSRLRSASDVLTLAVLVGPSASITAAFAMALMPVAANVEDTGSFPLKFLAQWLAGWTGTMMMAPFFFSLGVDYFRRWNATRVREWLLVNLLLVGSLLVMMKQLNSSDVALYPLAYLALPCVFWTAWRFGTSGAALANLLMGIITALCAKEGLGPFAGTGGILVLLPAWVFLLFHGLVALLLAAFTDERRQELMQQRQRARFLRQLLDELPLGVLLKGHHRQAPLLVNRRWFQFYGKAGGTGGRSIRSTRAPWTRSGAGAN